jgi:glycosyltransferase involved in cell wall biosynthesis
MAIPLPGDRTQRLRLPSFRGLSRAMRDLQPDVIVLPTPGPYGWWGARLATRRGIPVCAAHHTRLGELVALYWNGPLGRLAGSLLRRANGYFFRRSEIVLANSDEMVRSARAAGAREARLVGTPIAKCFLHAPTQPLASRLRSVLYVGRLAFEKNIEAVIGAAQRLPDVEFCVAGDGPQRGLVERAAAVGRNLRYVGWASREQLVSLIDNRQMLVLPSRMESFGTAAAEAMARRRLVLVSPQCGILDWQPLARGIFCMHEEEALADAIRRVADLPDETRQQRAAVGRRAAKSLNDRTMTQWIDVLEEIRSRRQQRS